jgi:hypothetical protein
VALGDSVVPVVVVAVVVSLVVSLETEVSAVAVGEVVSLVPLDNSVVSDFVAVLKVSLVVPVVVAVVVSAVKLDSIVLDEVTSTVVADVSSGVE